MKNRDGALVAQTEDHLEARRVLLDELADGHEVGIGRSAVPSKGLVVMEQPVARLQGLGGVAGLDDDTARRGLSGS